MLQELGRQGSWIIEGVVRFCLVAVVLVAGCFLALPAGMAFFGGNGLHQIAFLGHFKGG